MPYTPLTGRTYSMDTPQTGRAPPRESSMATIGEYMPPHLQAISEAGEAPGERTGRGKKGLFGGFKRVAQAVKTAAGSFEAVRREPQYDMAVNSASSGSMYEQRTDSLNRFGTPLHSPVSAPQTATAYGAERIESPRVARKYSLFRKASGRVSRRSSAASTRSGRRSGMTSPLRSQGSYETNGLEHQTSTETMESAAGLYPMRNRSTTLPLGDGSAPQSPPSAVQCSVPETLRRLDVQITGSPVFDTFPRTCNCRVTGTWGSRTRRMSTRPPVTNAFEPPLEPAQQPSESPVLIDSQYHSVVMNADKLQQYLKQ
ncbi:hypothetical protein DL89DRAFT_286858, partial [Linderina pennispora]